MNFPCSRVISLSVASFLATAVCATAQLLPEKEEDIPVEFISRLDNTVSIGFSRMQTGPKVRFGNLGMIQEALTFSSDESNTVSRLYSNGTVLKDSLWDTEKNLNGGPSWQSTLSDGLVTVYTPISYAQTRTQTDSLGNTTEVLIQNPNGSYVQVMVPGGAPLGNSTPDLIWASTSKYLGYVEGRSRQWSVRSESQIDTVNHTVSMSTYGATSAGAAARVDSAGSSGFELSLEHKLGQLGRFEWGIAGGLKLVDINAKESAVIPAYLTATTDVYKMMKTGYNDPFYNGVFESDGVTRKKVAISQPLGNASDLTLKNRDGGGQVYEYKDALSKPLGYTVGGDLSALTPLDINNVNRGQSERDPFGRMVNVHTDLQLKGAYFLMRLGPTFRYRFNDTYAVSGTVGLAQAWVGTTYRVDEVFNNSSDVFNPNGTAAPLSSATEDFRSTEENATHKFVPGIYGELNFEYWVTERTGFYLGVTQQTMRDYSQKPLSGRTVKVDLGSTSGWKIGIMTRF